MFDSLSWISWTRSWVLAFCLRYVLRWGIRAIVFASMCFLIRSFISVLAGVMSFIPFLFGTLGVGVFGIILSIVALWIGWFRVLWGCLVTLGVGAASLGSVSAGPLVVSSNVILFCAGSSIVVVGICSGLLLRMRLTF